MQPDWRIPSGLKNTHVSLTTNLEGRLKFEQDWLAEEDLPGFEAETTDFILCQLNIFARSGAFHCKRGREREKMQGVRNITLKSKEPETQQTLL